MLCDKRVDHSIDASNRANISRMGRRLHTKRGRSFNRLSCHLIVENVIDADFCAFASESERYASAYPFTRARHQRSFAIKQSHVSLRENVGGSSASILTVRQRG